MFLQLDDLPDYMQELYFSCGLLFPSAINGGVEMFFLKDDLVVKRIFTISMTLSMALFILPAYAAEEAVERDLGNSGQWSGGENVYAKVCGYCHDTGIGPSIKGRQLPPEYITHVVRHGFRAMPAFPEPYISNEDLKSLGQYIQQTTPEKK
ncbi:c-type cytochrome [Nitrosomonas eutropha]|nr:cytochrome c [Nitrosomonas eutropha]